MLPRAQQPRVTPKATAITSLYFCANPKPITATACLANKTSLQSSNLKVMMLICMLHSGRSGRSKSASKWTVEKERLQRERESKEVAGVASPCVVDLDHGVPLFGPMLYNNKHSVRQLQQSPAQQYFSLTPLQHQLPATSQPIIFLSHHSSHQLQL